MHVSSPPDVSLIGGQSRMFAFSQFSDLNARKRQLFPCVVALFTLMQKFVPIMVKFDFESGRSFTWCAFCVMCGTEDTPKHLWRVQGSESTPTTPLNYRVLMRRFLGPHGSVVRESWFVHYLCRQIQQIRHPTRDFSRTLSFCAHTTLWLKVSLVRFQSICMSSMMSHVWARVVCFRFVFFSISCLYFLSTVYMFFFLHINCHNVESVEDQNHCNHAQWGVLHHGDAQHFQNLWFHARCQHLWGHNRITSKRPLRSRFSRFLDATSVKATVFNEAHSQSSAESRKWVCGWCRHIWYYWFCVESSISTRVAHFAFYSSSCCGMCHHFGDVGTARVICLPRPDQKLAFVARRVSPWHVSFPSLSSWSEAGNETFCALSFHLDGALSLLEFQVEVGRCESYVSCIEKKMEGQDGRWYQCKRTMRNIRSSIRIVFEGSRMHVRKSWRTWERSLV